MKNFILSTKILLGCIKTTTRIWEKVWTSQTKMLAPWKKNLNSILKSRDITLPTKVHTIKTTVFPVVSHVLMWELDHKERWVSKKWCFQTVVLEKTLESPLDSKKIKPVNPTGNQPWISFGRTDAEAESLILWPHDAKNRLSGKDPDAGKDWGQEEKAATEDGTRLNGHEFEQALGNGDEQGSLVCCCPWGRKVGDGWTTEMNWTVPYVTYFYLIRIWGFVVVVLNFHVSIW